MTGQFNADPVVVAGGAGAIGSAVARGLVLEGATVALVDVSARVHDVAAELEQLWRDHYGDRKGAVVAIQADVSNVADVERAYAEATTALGDIYALLHCVGIFPRASLLDLSAEEWDRVLDINTRSFFLCAKVALADMLTRGRGRVVGMGSGVGVVGKPRSSAYAASKAAVMAFTRAVASELGHVDVTINCLSPGITESPMMRGANTDDEVRGVVARTGRPVTDPGELVAPILFLLSPAGRSVCGTSLWLHNP